MKIKAQLVARDADFNIVSEAQVGKHAVITNLAAETTEIIASDTIEIEGIVFVRSEGIFQVQLALGGFDSAGTFHRNLRYQPALMSLNKSREQDKIFWDSHDLDHIRVLDLDQIKLWIMESIDTLDRVALSIWGLPELETKLMDETTNAVIVDYRKQPKKIRIPAGPIPR